MNILIGIVFYLIIGAIVLAIFDMVTRRIQTKLDASAAETQSRMVNAGTYMSSRSSKILFTALMWLFWPVVLLGAATEKKGDSNGTQRQGTDRADKGGTGTAAG